nr:hypothetical protein [Novosphingobium pentaromativorans]
MRRPAMIMTSSGASLHRLRGPIAACILAMLVAACGVSPGGVSSASGSGGASRVPPVRQPSRTSPRDPKFLNLPGLEGVIGANQKQLVRQFGNPRLDVWEGDARKLQFTGTACVLDVFLYPTTSSREPVATYLDARRASDGQDVDRAACVAALRQP